MINHPTDNTCDTGDECNCNTHAYGRGTIFTYSDERADTHELHQNKIVYKYVCDKNSDIAHFSSPFLLSFHVKKAFNRPMTRRAPALIPTTLIGVDANPGILITPFHPPMAKSVIVPLPSTSLIRAMIVRPKVKPSPMPTPSKKDSIGPFLQA